MPDGSEFLLKVEVARDSNHLFLREKIVVLAKPMTTQRFEKIGAHQRDFIMNRNSQTIGR
jgi:hypothetical protein